MSKNKFSPKKYIIANGHKCPIYKCMISDDYENKGLTQCLLIRKQPGGKYMVALLLIDRYCLGIKNAMANCNLEDDELDEIIERSSINSGMEIVDSNYFHNMVYASLDYAQENGFEPHKDFALAEKVLDEQLIDDGIDAIEMGENGKPMFVSGPYDDYNRIINTLNKNVGEGNYVVIKMG